jgi:putative membrane protein
MSVFAQTVIILVALLHLGFLVLEMFLWEKPVGLKVFGQTKEQASHSKVLAANQGLYNGFLAAGLLWGWSLEANGTDIVIFFLCCVIAAGIFGAVTANRNILYIQALPAAIAIFLIYFT